MDNAYWSRHCNSGQTYEGPDRQKYGAGSYDKDSVYRLVPLSFSRSGYIQAMHGSTTSDHSNTSHEHSSECYGGGCGLGIPFGGLYYC
ncbi:hypothetical protein CCR75_009164 [Bremia lactucae]|uniref:Uncharacterized protein n=1 Tax=Bremia lactucae TaxID=4779 RepID=A0A976IC28_BRELC|nr:hypothetical protein CCR75_009164 [Bremia lactucae]